jgi:hypothetical protein
MLLFLDGFDALGAGNGTNIEMKYDGYNQTLLPEMAVGRYGGLAAWLYNTTFGECVLPKIFGPRSRFGVHVDYQLVPAPDIQPLEWLRMGTSTQTLLALYQRPDGRCEVRKYAGSTATTLDVPSTQFSPAWVNVQFQADFGAAARWELRVAGSTISAGTTSLAATLPDRVSLRASHYGPPAPKFDNYAIWDGIQGDGYNDFIGPSQVTTVLPSRDVAASGWSRNGAGALYSAVNEPGHASGTAGPDAPDRDTTYIYPAGGGKAWFGVRSPCFARVNAVALNMVARQMSGNPTIRSLVKLGGTEYELAAATAFPPLANDPSQWWLSTEPWRSRQIMAAKNPATGEIWIDSEISQAAWGVESSGDIRLTQLYLEKLTTLSGAPFSCGGAGSWSWGQ